MPNMDFYEVDPLDEPSVDSPKEEGGGDKQEKEDYEQICYLCKRTESVAGKLIRMPQNICICQDCMQKTFDAMNGSGFPMGDMMGNMPNMPNISMINLGDMQGFSPFRQRVKKKKGFSMIKRTGKA